MLMADKCGLKHIIGAKTPSARLILPSIFEAYVRPLNARECDEIA
ncbi:hypothetical protein SAMN04488244_103193 [Vibrio hangzhouensis]|uniref:Uncharacterized protein n=1 Tax=Vibrio hangzhouensis TaxID=462991 RepID=A0A1H5UIE2_9VIBR|nr:hypothetical protein SAMN04488244_103193 [Vibrio hangzhouensis]